jgi:hypothetical protein
LQARVVQLCDGAGVKAAWHQPGRRPRQSPPVITDMGRCVSGSAAPHRPLGPPQPVQLRHQRPGAVLQVPQVAVAVERPAVDTARPTAPVAGLRGTRTGVVGPRPAAALVALVEPGSGREADLPGPARRPAPHEASPPGLVTRLRPTHHAGGHGRAGAAWHLHRTPRAVGPAGHGLVRPATPRRDHRRVLGPRVSRPAVGFGRCRRRPPVATTCLAS